MVGKYDSIIVLLLNVMILLLLQYNTHSQYAIPNHLNSDLCCGLFLAAKSRTVADFGRTHFYVLIS